jgi:hypothetical protein
LIHETLKAAPDGTEDDRIIVGIGETVQMSIGNFEDPDDDPYSDEQQFDSMGGVTWASSAQNLATVSPSGLVTFKKISVDYSVTITATVDDAGNYEDDDPVPKSLEFHAIIPTGHTTIIDQGLLAPFTAYTPSASGNTISTYHRFGCQILPTSVNFDGLIIQENIPLQSFTWPNSTPDSHGPEIVGPAIVGPANLFADKVGHKTGGFSKSFLWNGTSYVGFGISLSLNLEYELVTPTHWKPFAPVSHAINYYSNGKCYVERESFPSSEDGPWLP